MLNVCIIYSYTDIYVHVCADKQKCMDIFINVYNKYYLFL